MLREALTEVALGPITHQVPLAGHRSGLPVILAKLCEVEFHALWHPLLSRPDGPVQENRSKLVDGIDAQGRGTGILDEATPMVVGVATLTVIFW